MTDGQQELRRPESVLVIIYSADGLLLLLQRSDDPNFWQSVTGSLMADELALTAAHRELLEETGLVVPEIVDCQSSHLFEIRPRWRYRYEEGVTHNREHVFLAPLPGPCDISLHPDEHLAYEWVALPQAVERLWSPSNRKAVQEFVLPRLGL